MTRRRWHTFYYGCALLENNNTTVVLLVNNNMIVAKVLANNNTVVNKGVLCCCLICQNVEKYMEIAVVDKKKIDPCIVPLGRTRIVPNAHYILEFCEQK